MKLILLSGGSGQRLWPLTNGVRSKQFLKILQNDQGKPESMVQRVWRQLTMAGLADKAVFATSKAQKDMLHKQLGDDIKLIIEPERRDTFPAIALAAAYFHTMAGCSEDEVIGVFPVDSLVEDDFFIKASETEAVLDESGADLALLGVCPLFPTEKYGYILPEERGKGEEYRYVKGFREKPSREEAEKLIEEKALWNCGVFSFKLKFLLSILSGMELPTDYHALFKNYQQLPKISFDYQVVERVENLVVVSYRGKWKDLGTWNTLTEEMSDNLWGNGIIASDSRNTQLINELDIPVIVLGINDSVVAATPDGILVSDKNSSLGLKKYVNQIQLRPMYEERGWGWYKVLEYLTYREGYQVLIKRLHIDAGKNLSYQKHNWRAETWNIVQGKGEVAARGIIFPVKAGTVLEIPQGEKHSIRAVSDLELIEIQKGKELSEEDIERFTFDWKEIQNELHRNNPPI